MNAPLIAAKLFKLRTMNTEYRVPSMNTEYEYRVRVPRMISFEGRSE